MTGGAQTYTKADSALAGALELVNLEKVPVLTGLSLQIQAGVKGRIQYTAGLTKCGK